MSDTFIWLSTFNHNCSSAHPTAPHAHHLASCSPHRILHLYAEENAIDDTIYYLSEALRKGVISLDVFLKVTDCVCSCVHACVEGMYVVV